MLESPETNPIETFLIISLETSSEETGPNRYVFAVNFKV